MATDESVCEACGNTRYAPEALGHRLGGRAIAEALALTADEAAAAFEGTAIAAKLAPLAKVGLGYLHLEQALSTLSGGRCLTDCSSGSAPSR